MKITYQAIKKIVLTNFNDVSFEKNKFGMFLYFENGEQVRISILSGRKQHNDTGIHIHSLETKEELAYHIVDAVEVANRDCFANIYIHLPLTPEEQAENDRIKGMQARIKAEVEEQSNARNILESSVLPGDVVQVGVNHFILVITKDRFNESSFYYTPCNFDGSLTTKEYEMSAANYINNSVMLSRVALSAEIVNCVELKSQTVVQDGQEYTWYLTGDFEIDSYMSQLDARYALFSAKATAEDRKNFDRNEDRNYHSENGDFVTAFCNGLVK